MIAIDETTHGISVSVFRAATCHIQWMLELIFLRLRERKTTTPFIHVLQSTKRSAPE
jgi:hypothetical protein